MSYFGVLARKFVPYMLALSVICFAPRCSFADASSASLSIIVTDSSGAVVQNAKVLLHNSETNQEQVSLSGKSGTANFAFVKPGRYSLIVSKTDFSDVTVEHLLLNVGDQKHLELVLRVGTTNQNVTVDGGGTTINATNASVSTVIDRQFVANIPLNGRSFQDLISTTPGVVTANPQAGSTAGGQVQSAQTPGSGGDFSVNGQRTESNYYIIDGISSNTSSGPGAGASGPAMGGVVAATSALGTTQSLLSVDALQEFRVESSTYSAEYGRSPGGQFTFVTRSGTNSYHGNAYDYLRNGYFDANDWFNDHLGQTKQELHQNDFGGTLGGPVQMPRLYNGRDRTFFFASYEGLRLTQPTAASVQYVPDIYLRQQAPAAIQPLLNAFPQQSEDGIDYGTRDIPGLAQFLSGYSLPARIDSTSIRVDQALNKRLSLFFRFGDTPSSISTRSLSALSKQAINAKSYTLGTTFIFSNRLVDQLRFGYSRGDSTTTSSIDTFGGAQPINLGQALAPSIGITNTGEVELYISGIGASVLEAPNAGAKGRQYNLTDALDVEFGTHHLKMGVDYRRIKSVILPSTPLIFGLYESAAQILSNTSYEGEVQYEASAVPIFNETALFVQDDWRLRPALSISMGLRWELDPPPTSGNGYLPRVILGDVEDPTTLQLAPSGTPLWNTAWYNFAPRLGSAWQLHREPGRETVLRTGVGVFFDTNNEAAALAFQGIGFQALATYRNTPLPLTASQAQLSITANPPYPTISIYPTHLQLPYTLGWNLSLEQSLGPRQSLSISYVGSAGRRLSQHNEASISKIDPRFTSINYFPGGITSDYDSLQLKLTRRVSAGLNVLASYTWSHSIDLGSNYAELPLQRGNSDFDIRNNFQAAFSWDVPGTKSRGPIAVIWKGWGIDGRVMARTGFPITLRGNLLTDPSTGNEYYGNVDFIAGRPLYIYGSQFPGGRMINGGKLATNPAIVSAASGGSGNAPRNFIRGFGAVQGNVALRREFRLGEGTNLQLRAETFNVTNHPIFGYVDPTLTDLTFGQAAQTLNQSLSTVSSEYQQGGPRSMQFALKVRF